MTDQSSRLNAALEGRYTVHSELGQGGMATVYLADDLKHERKVAIKVLKPELAAMLGGERFLTEIKTTANLQHPHILPLFDSGVADGFLFYVMPYVDGETLRDKLSRERQIGVDESLHIAKAVASALQYAHDHDVIHRDIKPENILIHAGQPVVADFGIALAVSAAGGGRMTETGLSLGTPHYMSPEQATADRDLSARSDVYSLACVLYEMLAGDPPHTGPTAQSILMRILTEAPRPVTEVRASVPPHVSATLVKALEKLPADRFESAEDFGKALEDRAFVYTAAHRVPATGLATAAVPVASVAPRGRLQRLAPWGVAAALAVAALAGWLRPEPVGPTVRLDLSLGAMTIDPLSDVVISPDGTMLAVAGLVDDDPAIYVRRLDEADFRMVPGTAGGRNPSFSPDGEWIVFVDASPGGGVRRVAATGGEAEMVFRGVGRRPHLLPDGSGMLAVEANSIWYQDLTDSSVFAELLPGTHPVYVRTGHILYVAPSGGLFAVPFDLDAHELTGSPTPVLERVASNRVRRGYTISRAGTLVHLEGEGGASAGMPNTRFLIYDMEGRADTVRLRPGPRQYPRFSPDGRTIVYQYVNADRNNEQDIYTFDLSTGTNTQITFEGDNERPVWSPDGTRILFNSNGREGADGEDLFVKPADNSGPAESVLTQRVDQDPWAWLDGDLVVFHTVAQGQRDLFMFSLSGGAEPEPYLQAPWVEDSFSPSPDGTLAAFVSTETESREVWIRDFPDPVGKWRVSTGGGESPRWSPDGSTVYFWRMSGGGSADTLFAAPVERGPGVVVRQARPVWAGRILGDESWDLHPDGDRFIVAVGAEDPTAASDDAGASGTRYLVVLNWFEELKGLLGEGG